MHQMYGTRRLFTLGLRQLLLCPRRSRLGNSKAWKGLSFTASLFNPAGGTVLNPAKGSIWTSKVQWELLVLEITSAFLSWLMTSPVLVRRFHWSTSPRLSNSTNPSVTTPGTSSTKELRNSGVIMLGSSYVTSVKNISVIKVLLWMRLLITLLSEMEVLRETYGLSWTWWGPC